MQSKGMEAKKFSSARAKQVEAQANDEIYYAKEDNDTKKLTFENNSKYEKNKEMEQFRVNPSYVVVDIETTGFSPKWEEITEIGAIKVVGGKIACQMQSLIKIKKRVPPEVTKLTGITDEMLAADGKPLRDVMMELLAFIEDLPIVAHNSRFDLSFINAALEQLQQPKLTNKIIDTLALSKRLLKSLGSYKLEDLSSYFGHKLPSSDENKNRLHRSLGDCYLTYLLYEKLRNLD